MACELTGVDSEQKQNVYTELNVDTDDLCEEVVLHLKALPDSVPAVNRLRRLLKACLRAYGFQCLSVRQASDPNLQKGQVDAGRNPPS